MPIVWPDAFAFAAVRSLGVKVNSATVPADVLLTADDAAVETAAEPAAEAMAAELVAEDDADIAAEGAAVVDTDDELALEALLDAPPGPSELQPVASRAIASTLTAATRRLGDRLG